MKALVTIFALSHLLTSAAIAQQQPECDPRYEGACLPVYRSNADDVDCSEIADQDFRVVTIGEDPHRLDRDKDGIACESPDS